MKFKRTILSVSIAAAVATLSACGGGGGGGSPNPIIRNETQVPFYTPTRIATIDTLTNDRNNAIMDNFTATLSGGTQEEVIVAGRSVWTADASTHPSSKITIFGWENGTLKDKTSQWFSGTDNIILGTEPSVKFGDFNNSGKLSMWVAPSTDGVINTQPGYIFINNGSSFTRYEIPMGSISSHDSVVYDVNRDGIADIVTLDYGPNGTFIFGNRSNTFTPLSVNNGAFGGSGIAAGDFLNNGSTTFIVTDTGNSQYSTRLFSWSLSGGTVSVQDIGTLPLPRFELPKYDGIITASPGENRSHNIRVLAFDYDSNGVMDAVIISRPSNMSNTVKSEIQFLKNNGTGVFSDTTDNVVVGYDIYKNASYNPKLIDVNNDGLIDLLLPAQGNDQTQILLHTKENKFVSAYLNIITDFAKQASSLEPYQLGSTGGIVNLVKGPNGDLYLISLLDIEHSTGPQKSLYLSKIGSTGTLNAQASIDLIKQVWPYMSTASANQVLASTGTQYFGATIIDLDKILEPYGNLMMPTANGRIALNGYINGVNLGSFNQLKVVDQLGRDFSVNMSSTQVNGLNRWGWNTEAVDTHQVVSYTEYLIGSNAMVTNGFRLSQDPKNYSIGIPAIALSNQLTLNAQFSSLSFNPWIQFGGVYGTVNSSSITEVVGTWRKNNWQGQLGLMYNTTNISPGLITHVNNMWGAWAEFGWRELDRRGQGFGVYAGVQPVMIGGKVEANLPTGIDSSGNIQYTKTNLAVQNPITGYVRVMYNTQLNRNTMLNLGAMLVENGQYRAQAQIKFNY